MELLQRDLAITRGCDGLGRCAQLLTLLLAFPRYAEKARELRLSGLPLVRAEGPSEAAESWYMLFHAFAEAYKTFTGESAKIAAMIIDQNYAAPKAAKMVDAFKEATICNDVVHLYRAVEEKHKDKMKNPLFLYTYVQGGRPTAAHVPHARQHEASLELALPLMGCYGGERRGRVVQ